MTCSFLTLCQFAAFIVARGLASTNSLARSRTRLLTRSRAGFLALASALGLAAVCCPAGSTPFAAPALPAVVAAIGRSLPCEADPAVRERVSARQALLVSALLRERGAAEAGTEPPSLPLAVPARARAVFNRLATVAGPASRAWTLMLYPGKELAAQASASGVLAISTGSWTRTQGDEALFAAIVAHEIGHLKLRHAVKTECAFHARLLAVTEQLGKAPASAVTEALDRLDADFKALSHRHELEADLYGAELLESAGFEPGRMLELLALLDEGPVSKTHPTRAQRVIALKAYLEPPSR